jgi:hypothetical protein
MGASKSAPAASCHWLWRTPRELQRAGFDSQACATVTPASMPCRHAGNAPYLPRPNAPAHRPHWWRQIAWPPPVGSRDRTARVASEPRPPIGHGWRNTTKVGALAHHTLWHALPPHAPLLPYRAGHDASIVIVTARYLWVLGVVDVRPGLVDLGPADCGERLEGQLALPRRVRADPVDIVDPAPRPARSTVQYSTAAYQPGPIPSNLPLPACIPVFQ